MIKKYIRIEEVEAMKIEETNIRKAYYFSHPEEKPTEFNRTEMERFDRAVEQMKKYGIPVKGTGYRAPVGYWIIKRKDSFNALADESFKEFYTQSPEEIIKKVGITLEPKGLDDTIEYIYDAKHRPTRVTIEESELRYKVMEKNTLRIKGGLYGVGASMLTPYVRPNKKVHVGQEVKYLGRTRIIDKIYQDTGYVKIIDKRLGDKDVVHINNLEKLEHIELSIEAIEYRLGLEKGTLRIKGKK